MLLRITKNRCVVLVWKYIHFLLAIRHMHPKTFKSFRLSFKFFEYLSYEFESFANLLQISKKINLNLKKVTFWVWIQFEKRCISIWKIRKKIKIDTQIHTQKIIFFLFILNYLIRNLQEIRKILKLKYSKNLKLKPKLKPQSIFECICLLTI